MVSGSFLKWKNQRYLLRNCVSLNLNESCEMLHFHSWMFFPSQTPPDKVTSPCCWGAIWGLHKVKLRLNQHRWTLGLDTHICSKHATHGKGVRDCRLINCQSTFEIIGVTKKLSVEAVEYMKQRQICREIQQPIRCVRPRRSGCQPIGEKGEQSDELVAVTYRGKAVDCIPPNISCLTLLFQ